MPTFEFVLNLIFATITVGLVAVDLVAAEAFETQGKMIPPRFIEYGR